MLINPTLDKVVIKKYDYSKIYNHNIILTNTNKDDINKMIYEVIEVGPGGQITEDVYVEMNVSVGDIVVVEEYVGSEVEINGEFYRIVKQNNILAILELEGVYEK